MAGRGPAPKPSERRARRNADPIGATVLEFVRGKPKDLPEGIAWHPRTIEWWRNWQQHSIASTLTAVDWDFLLDTALLHHLAWAEGEVKHFPEIRLRVAKYGATLEDRARLRITFANADEAEDRRPQRGTSARERRGGLPASG